MSALCLTACMMEWPSAACFNYVFLPTNVFISSSFKDWQVYKLNIIQEVKYIQQRGYISFLVSTAFISDYICFAAVSLALNFGISGSSGLGKL